MFFDPALPRRVGQLALAALAHRGLAATVRAHRPDIVVTEYPVLSATLGQLRSMGRFPLPLVSSISDPAGLYYWAHPGVDMHLLAWPESAAEVDRIAGPGRSVAVRPLVDARFLQRLTRGGALVALTERALLPSAWTPDADRLVVVSGGGWGIGDLSGAVDVALGAGAAVIALAGRSATAEAQLRADHGSDPRVRVVGFTDQMPSILAAADALIHTTGGTTALEARLLGCPLINYGTGVAHVRAHAAALVDQGLAGWARQRSDLGPELAAALAAGRRTRLDAGALPDAADVVIDVALASR
jgi:UDP-N-acetylglucosamine:LPS N-acetylglucosamine transferase